MSGDTVFIHCQQISWKHPNRDRNNPTGKYSEAEPGAAYSSDLQ